MGGGLRDVGLAKAMAASTLEASADAAGEGDGTVAGEILPVWAKSGKGAVAFRIKVRGYQAGDEREWTTGHQE